MDVSSVTLLILVVLIFLLFLIVGAIFFYLQGIHNNPNTSSNVSPFYIMSIIALFIIGITLITLIIVAAVSGKNNDKIKEYDAIKTLNKSLRKDNDELNQKINIINGLLTSCNTTKQEILQRDKAFIDNINKFQTQLGPNQTSSGQTSKF